MIVMCFDESKAKKMLFDVAIQLQTNKRLSADFWQLFYSASNASEKKSQMKTISEFITENDVKVKGMGIWQSIRWENWTNSEWWTYRPDFILYDDIDTDKTVYSKIITENTYNFVKWETMGWVDDNCQQVFLCNVINQDWVWVRLKKELKDIWKIYSVFYNEDNNPRPEKFTEEYVNKKKKELWETFWLQNYCWVPYTWGDWIIKREYIKYYDYDIWPEFITIGVDPAISVKNHSDDFAIVVTGHIGDKKYVMEAVFLSWEQKKPNYAIEEVERLYKYYNANLVMVEATAFQQVLADLVKDRKIAVKEIKPHKDKVTRLMEWVSYFETGRVFFSNNCGKLVEQIVNFPNGKYDDWVDAMEMSFHTRWPNKFVFAWF